MEIIRDYYIESEEALLNLAMSLGNPISSRVNYPVIDNLLPTQNENAHRKSLSREFGAGDFPFHTDGAYFPIPPRFILMRYVDGRENPTPTIICSLAGLDSIVCDNLKYSVWKIATRSGFKYSSILSPDGHVFRYDRNIMTPVNRGHDNGEYFERLVNELPRCSIGWRKNYTVLINNWQSIHMRPKVRQDEIGRRHLQRIMIL